MKLVRNMQPKDYPALWQLAKAQNRRDSTSYPLPPIFDFDDRSPRFGQLMPNAALALVTEVDGRVRQGHVFLRTIEAMSFGGGRETMEFSAGHIGMACQILKRLGYDDLHTFVPVERASEEHTALLGANGLTRIDPRLAHFFRML